MCVRIIESPARFAVLCALAIVLHAVGAHAAPPRTFRITDSVGTVVGKVDEQGVVTAGAHMGTSVGRVDRRGVIYRGGFGNEAGRVDVTGRVYDSARGGNEVGRVDSGGRIFAAKHPSTCIGRVEPADTNAGGAACVLLFEARTKAAARPPRATPAPNQVPRSRLTSGTATISSEATVTRRRFP